MSRRKVVVQRTLTFDLPTKAVLFAYRLSSPHHHTHIHSLLPPPSLMLYICACVYTICGCLEQRGQRGRRLTMKRMKSSTAMMVTMETQPAWGRGGESGASAGIMLVRFNMQPSVQPASLPFIWTQTQTQTQEEGNCHCSLSFVDVTQFGRIQTVVENRLKGENE